jgi:hypothetical protein
MSTDMTTTDLARWDRFLRDIASGLELQAAGLKNRVTRADIDSITRADPLQDKRWQDARLAAERRSWSALDLAEVFERIGGGASVLDAVLAVRGTDETASLYRLCASDPGVEDQFLAAQAAWALRESQALLGLADDKKGDVLITEKGPQGNMAAVNRSRLQIESRQWLMGKMAPRIFSENRQKVEVNVNFNYAERLERAHANAKAKRVVTREQMKKAIDAVAVPVEEVPALPQPAAPVEAAAPVEMDTSWIDTKPTDDPTASTIWREDDPT